MDSSLLLTLPGIGYCAAGALHLARLARGSTGRSPALAALVYGSLAVHAAGAVERIAHTPVAPLTSVRESAVIVSLLLVAGCLAMGRRLRGEATAAIVMLVAGVALIVASLSLPASPGPVPDILRSPWLLLHVPLSLAAFVLYALAGCAAAVYLAVSALLKSRRPLELLRRLPTLDSLERFSHRMAELSFPLLTAGLVTGMMWAQGVWGSPLQVTPKQLVAVVTWLVYAAYFHARFVQGMRGRACAWILVAGCLISVVGYILAVTGVDAHSFL